MGAALTLTEEDRALLVLLSPEQAGTVLQALLGVELYLSDDEQMAFDAIAKRLDKRRGGAARWRRWKEKHSDVSQTVSLTVSQSVSLTPPPSPASPPVSPLFPPSPSPPITPLSTPPYNPPSTTPSPTPTPGEHPRARADAYSGDFEVFWKAYPRKIGKQAAWRAFQRVKVPLETLVDAVERQKCSAQWRESGGKYIPHPTTWLNQGRWEDEVPAESTVGAGSGDCWRTSNPFLELLEEMQK